MSVAFLQWGRGFDTAETCWSKRSSSCTEIFNGAAVLIPRKLIDSSPEKSARRIFNGAAVLIPRKPSSRTPRYVPLAIFNGAAVLIPRKPFASDPVDSKRLACGVSRGAAKTGGCDTIPSRSNLKFLSSMTLELRVLTGVSPALDRSIRSLKQSFTKFDARQHTGQRNQLDFVR